MPNCWYGKLDLSNCFLSFPLHPDVWPHFIFRFEGALYQFRRMPFGLSSAPRICTLILSVVAYRLSRENFFRLIRYLDDFLFIASSQAEMAQCLPRAQQIFSDFGLVVNTDKTEGPAQQLSFLGILLDSVNQTLACTPERVKELTSLLASAASSPQISLSALASLIGKAAVRGFSAPWCASFPPSHARPATPPRRTAPPTSPSGGRQLSPSPPLYFTPEHCLHRQVLPSRCLLLAVTPPALEWHGSMAQRAI